MPSWDIELFEQYLLRVVWFCTDSASKSLVLKFLVPILIGVFYFSHFFLVNWRYQRPEPEKKNQGDTSLTVTTSHIFGFARIFQSDNELFKLPWLLEVQNFQSDNELCNTPRWSEAFHSDCEGSTYGHSRMLESAVSMLYSWGWDWFWSKLV